MNLDTGNLIDYFQAEIRRCPRFYYDTDIFGQVRRLRPEEAFALIPAAVDIAMLQTDIYPIVVAAFLISGLARRSGTTEMPDSLRQRWDDLIAHLEVVVSQESFIAIVINELRCWYRKGQ